MRHDSVSDCLGPSWRSNSTEEIHNKSNHWSVNKAHTQKADGLNDRDVLRDVACRAALGRRLVDQVASGSVVCWPMTSTDGLSASIGNRSGVSISNRDVERPHPSHQSRCRRAWEWSLKLQRAQDARPSVRPSRINTQLYTNTISTALQSPHGDAPFKSFSSSSSCSTRRARPIKTNSGGGLIEIPANVGCGFGPLSTSFLFHFQLFSDAFHSLSLHRYVGYMTATIKRTAFEFRKTFGARKSEWQDNPSRLLKYHGMFSCVIEMVHASEKQMDRQKLTTQHLDFT